MSQPFIISWHDFVVYAMLEIKNGWPLLDDDVVEFKDKQGNAVPSLPDHVVITLHKRVQNGDKSK